MPFVKCKLLTSSSALFRKCCSLSFAQSSSSVRALKSKRKSLPDVSMADFLTKLDFLVLLEIWFASLVNLICLEAKIISLLRDLFISKLFSYLWSSVSPLLSFWHDNLPTQPSLLDVFWLMEQWNFSEFLYFLRCQQLDRIQITNFLHYWEI